MRPRRRLPLLHAAAGSQAGSPRFAPLRRPPSPPLARYMRPVTVPVGNDGIALPVTFTAAGTAQAAAGPSGVGCTWSLDQASIYTSVGPLDAAQAALYVGPLPIAQYQQASSLAGGGAQVALGGITVDPSWFVWVLWTGGTPGALAYLLVTGAKTVLAQ
jgi:hypothetical protein